MKLEEDLEEVAPKSAIAGIITYVVKHEKKLYSNVAVQHKQNFYSNVGVQHEKILNSNVGVNKEKSFAIMYAHCRSLLFYRVLEFVGYSVCAQQLIN